MKKSLLLLLSFLAFTSLCAQQIVYKGLATEGKDKVFEANEHKAIVVRKLKTVDDKGYKAILLDDKEYLVNSTHLKRDGRVVATFHENEILMANANYSYTRGQEWTYRRDTTVVMKVRYELVDEKQQLKNVVIDLRQSDENSEALFAMAFYNEGVERSRNPQKNIGWYIVGPVAAVLGFVLAASGE